MTACQILVTVAAMVLSFAAAGIFFSVRMRKKVDYMLDALEDNETNFRFREDAATGRKFNRTLNRIRQIFEKERAGISEQEKYYGQMLDHVQTGIIVTDENGGGVEYCNARALEILEMSSLSSIRQIRRSSPELADALAAVCGGHEEKAVCTGKSSSMTLSVTASSATIRGRRVKIAAFNDISSDMEENEAESWTKLIRVLTHEIMNTVTPIASLSEALAQYAVPTDAAGGSTEAAGRQDAPEAAGPDFRAGLEAISSASRSLIRFVDSYRSLTRMPTPEKSAFYLRELVDNVLRLMEKEMREADITCSYLEKSEDILLYADMGQISQIFVNMLKNAVQAEATEIEIDAEIDKTESVVVNVSNNGLPISRENREEIFVPFYTTKPSGSGIGLSISRQIMRLHNGSIRLTRSDGERTTFTLTFR